MRTETIAYFYTDRSRADLKRAQIHTANDSNLMVVRSLFWKGDIDWSQIYLVVIDYTAENHNQINELLKRLALRNRPPIVVIDPNYKSLDEINRASELDYFHCIREPINQNDLRSLITSARRRYIEESKAHVKWPIVMRKETLIDIQHNLKNLTPGEINYVLTQIQSHNQIYSKFVLGVNKTYVDSKHLLKVVNLYKTNNRLVNLMLAELKARGDYFITTGRIQAELILKQSIRYAEQRIKSHDAMESLFTESKSDAVIAKKLIIAKIRSGESHGLALALNKAMKQGENDKSNVMEELSELSTFFYQQGNTIKAQQLRRELTLFNARLNRKISLPFHKELLVIYFGLLSNQYYIQGQYVAAKVYRELAHEHYEELSSPSKFMALVPMLLLSVWQGDIFMVDRMVKLGEKKIDDFKVLGASRDIKERYSLLKRLYHRMITGRATSSVCREVSHYFPNSEIESLCCNGDVNHKVEELKSYHKQKARVRQFN
ncbi:hypothetical protein OH460_08935 [Vibrio sp. Makdt]|uniref:hypothetical protein n=1 Tax=Vibrio sp. Makdt TaxID=2998828 RepID=UPI0022CD43AB|nr:hypothetical protein [Vibrio sp. Makdt]MDA0152426.1 hypothetical protein [Vibrio sp. Makdt]